MNEAIDRAPRVAERSGVTQAIFASEIAAGDTPVVMRGLVSDWPAVKAGRGSPGDMADYLLQFDGGGAVNMMVGAPEIGGRFFYRDDMGGFNFERARITLPLLIDQLLRQVDDPVASSLYAGAAPASDLYPGWTAANRLPLETPEANPRVWIGNASKVATHYDVSSNVAAVVAGRRRFALFPPAEGENLYVGPLDMTIAGQPTSMVDLESPDLDRYPRFARALEAMVVAELEPGDAIYIPSLWWHDVKAIGSLNVLVNYWWGQEAEISPFPALIHAIFAVRDLTPAQREAVRGWFDQYVFGDMASGAANHLPHHARGVLGEPSPERANAVRDYLIRALSRR